MKDSMLKGRTPTKMGMLIVDMDIDAN